MFFRIYRDSVAKQALEYEAGNVRCSQSVLVKRWLLIVFLCHFFQISLCFRELLFCVSLLQKNNSWDFNRTILPSFLLETLTELFCQAFYIVLRQVSDFGPFLV